jgi:hypothetical protein
MQTKILSVLLIKDHDDGQWWIAQCLEHDIAAQAHTVEDAVYELGRMIAGRMIAAADLGLGDAFVGVPTAPSECWETFLANANAMKITHEPEFAAPQSPMHPLVRPRLEARLVASVS